MGRLLVGALVKGLAICFIILSFWGEITIVTVEAILGLPPDGIQKNGIYVGVLPDFNVENPRDVNRALGAPVAIVGDYLTISPDDTSLSNAGYHFSALKSIPNGTVYAPTILPSLGLSGDNWNEDMENALVDMVSHLNRRKITVWLRFASEMNGGWMTYGRSPNDFIQVWRSLTTAIRSRTNDTYMLWSPNVYAGDDANDSNQLQGYSAYWPGAEYVDVAGLSFYSLGIDQQQNTLPQDALFENLFQPFYSLYGSQVPIVISETSAPYHYQTPASLSSLPGDADIPSSAQSHLDLSTLTPYPGGASQLDMKTNWTRQLLADDNNQRWPNLTAVSFFNYLKIGNASAAQLNDHRIIGNDEVGVFYRQFLGNQTAYDEGYDGKAFSNGPPSVAITVTVVFVLIAVLLR